jgi:hypothetical protein
MFCAAIPIKKIRIQNLITLLTAELIILLDPVVNHLFRVPSLAKKTSSLNGKETLAMKFHLRANDKLQAPNFK